MSNLNVTDLLDNELRPQINKLRFIRELTLGSKAEMSGLTDENDDCLMNGLHQILYEATMAFDQIYNKIDGLRSTGKEEVRNE